MQSTVIEKNLLLHLEKSLPHHLIKEVYHYALFPGGKYFRPHLVWAILADLNPSLYSQSALEDDSNHARIASSVEIHHTYTLLHDDLPCMDDDKLRRGKACTHIKYGEWQALLAGDGMLNISYQLISKINHIHMPELFKLYSWALGPKGLIHGQTLDLSHEMANSLSNTIRTHELKTARLIQVAIMGSALLANSKRNLILEKKLWRYSLYLGVLFQLIDDLSELAEENLTAHESEVNPWLKFTEETYSLTLKYMHEFKKVSDELKLSKTSLIVDEYFHKMLMIIEPNRKMILKHLKKEIDLAPAILFLKNFSLI